jgi:ribosomal protein L34E
MASMSSMMVELANTMSSQGRNIKSLTYQRTLFPAPATKGNFKFLQKRKNWARTDAFHEPIEGIPGPRTLSIPRTPCSERTMLLTHGGVICRQCCGSSKGRAVTASFALSPPTRCLPDDLSNSSQKLQH